MLVFYDFEVFKHDWLMVCIEPGKGKISTIVNSKMQLELLYREHMFDVWVGYNSRNYDQYILKAILLGFDPYEVSDWIINQNRKGWEYSSLFNAVQLYNYDCMSKFYSLKQLESFMGNDIRETSVPFDIDRKLTHEELTETVKYCMHDVEQTMLVFLQKKADFDAHVNMLYTFRMPLSYIGKTQAQLSAIALRCNRKEHFDEWDLQIVDTLRLEKYAFVKDWFLDNGNHDYSNRLEVGVCGVPHVFGWGGLHGAPDKPIHRKGLIVHVDVTSFYPSIMIRYDFLSRNVKDKSAYKEIYDTRVRLKQEGKKEEQAPYKIILNSTYGICKDPYSSAYDPRQANNVCVNGQLLLLDLLEHLEGHCDILQSNTDGLIVQIPDTGAAFDELDDICFEWESRTGMKLGFDIISEIWQKDVNNYLWIAEDGTVERKGAYVKELTALDCDLVIVNRAMVAYMVEGTPVEKTIGECDELKDFQKVVKVSGKYECGYHNGRKLKEKTFRVFASTDNRDSWIGKIKNGNIEKFANTPAHCFIDNSDINGKPIPKKLDKGYYIELARERLRQFGIID